MSQEQARGRWDEVDARSDVWAVGATLFTLLTGEFVHPCDTANEQLGRAMTMPARSLASVAPDLPAGLTAVIDRALRFDRDERWPDARSMQQALRALSASGTASVARDDARRPHRSAASLASTASGSIAAASPVVERARSARVALMALALGISIVATAGVHALFAAPAPSAAGRDQRPAVPTASTRTKAMRADPALISSARLRGDLGAAPAAELPTPASDKPKTLPRVTRPRVERDDPATRRAAARVNPFDLRY
jgi:serine/threonine-protein kinase